MAHDFPVNEKQIPLTRVPEHPILRRQKKGKKLHINAIERWVRRGLDPSKIRLRTVKVDGITCTNSTFLREFFSALKQASNNQSHAINQQNLPQNIKSELDIATRVEREKNPSPRPR